MIRKITGGVLALACCGALAACGGGNPKVSDGSAFVSSCTSKIKSQEKGKLPASLNLNTLCGCIQQKLQAAGQGNLTINDLNNKTNSKAQAAVIPCAEQAVPGLTGGASPGAVPATPSTTT